MPKKKAKAIQIIDDVVQVECDCPYCGEQNYTELPHGCEKDEDYCVNCGKVFIVDIREKETAGGGGL